MESIKINIDTKPIDKTKELLESLIGSIENKTFVEVLIGLSKHWNKLNSDDKDSIKVALAGEQDKIKFETLLDELNKIIK